MWDLDYTARIKLYLHEDQSNDMGSSGRKRGQLYYSAGVTFQKIIMIGALML